MSRRLWRISVLFPVLGALLLLTRLHAVVSEGSGAVAQPVRTSADEQVLPAGVKAVWDLEKAQREKTATRERVCLNGLWRWQPAKNDEPPAEGWGYFKVPAFWPGNSNYIREDCQT